MKTFLALITALVFCAILLSFSFGVMDGHIDRECAPRSHITQFNFAYRIGCWLTKPQADLMFHTSECMIVRAKIDDCVGVFLTKKEEAGVLQESEDWMEYESMKRRICEELNDVNGWCRKRSKNAPSLPARNRKRKKGE